MRDSSLNRTQAIYPIRERREALRCIYHKNSTYQTRNGEKKIICQNRTHAIKTVDIEQTERKKKKKKKKSNRNETNIEIAVILFQKPRPSISHQGFCLQDAANRVFASREVRKLINRKNKVSKVNKSLCRGMGVIQPYFDPFIKTSRLTFSYHVPQPVIERHLDHTRQEAASPLREIEDGPCQRSHLQKPQAVT